MYQDNIVYLFSKEHFVDKHGGHTRGQLVTSIQVASHLWSFWWQADAL